MPRARLAERAGAGDVGGDVSVSVKLATIAPSLTMAGVTIAPLRPPVPRLSVLPAPMLVPPAAFTTPPSAMLSVPIAVPVWPITSRRSPSGSSPIR